MHVRLGTLDVIVQIVAEELDVGDGRRCNTGCEVSGEQDERHIASIFRVPQSGNVPNFKRWLAGGIEDLRGVLNRWLAPGIDEFLLTGMSAPSRLPRKGGTHLKEHLPKDSVCLLLEDRGKDNGNTIGCGLHVYRLLVTVVYLHQFTLPSTRLQLLLGLECTLKRSGQSMALEERDRCHERIASLCYSSVKNQFFTNRFG